MRLQGVPHMGFSRLQKSAIKLNVSLSQLLTQSQEALLAIGWNSDQINVLFNHNKAIEAQTQKTLDWLQQSEHNHFISVECTDFPNLLKQISRPPLFLYVQGNLALLSSNLLAFVGSRNASIYANQACHELIQAMALYTTAGTVSGLALGVDAACHKASLANKVPTLAVLGCGIDVIYPKRHKQLYSDIAKQGALVSEFVLGTQPVASMFPRRNRIISGLSLGTVVIEAKMKSGTLVTAKYATEQNREVFALPNNITNPNAEGCHWLIKQGAKLVDDIADIIDELPQIKQQGHKINAVNSVAPQKMQKNVNQCLASDPLLDSVNYSATSIDEIAKRTGISLSDVLLQLLEYELRGLVASTADGYIKLRG